METTVHPLLGGSFIVDPIHSSFTFAVAYQGVSVFRAGFSEVSAKLVDGDLTGFADVESISIHRPQQFRAHVLGPEFFDVETHPRISFSSTALDLRDDGTAAVAGMITIKGSTQPVQAGGTWTAPSTDAAGRMRGHLHVEGVVDRRDFGLHWNAVLPSGAAALGHDVSVMIDASLVERTV